MYMGTRKDIFKVLKNDSNDSMIKKRVPWKREVNLNY
jgi:hypothetical protein